MAVPLPTLAPERGDGFPQGLLPPLVQSTVVSSGYNGQAAFSAPQPASAQQPQPAPAQQPKPTQAPAPAQAPTQAQAPAPAAPPAVPAPAVQQSQYQPAPAAVQNPQAATSTIPAAQTATQANSIREVVVTRGPTGLLGFEFAKNKTKPEDPYAVTVLYPQGAMAQSGLVRVGDEIHAIDGKPIAALQPEQVIELVKGPPNSQIRLKIRTPPTKA